MELTYIQLAEGQPSSWRLAVQLQASGRAENYSCWATRWSC